MLKPDKLAPPCELVRLRDVGSSFTVKIVGENPSFISFRFAGWSSLTSAFLVIASNPASSNVNLISPDLKSRDTKPPIFHAGALIGNIRFEIPGRYGDTFHSHSTQTGNSTHDGSRSGLRKPGTGWADQRET